MDINEMHLAVQQGVDKINSFQADTLLPEEIDLELNKAIGRFVNTKYGKNNLYNKGFEETQKRIDDLRVLVTDHSLKFQYLETSVNDTHVYSSSEFPEDYRFMLKGLGVVKYKDNCTALNSKEQEMLVDIESFVEKKSSIRFVQQDDILTLLSDPFNTTTKEKPLITIEDKMLMVFTSDIFIIDSVKLTYIKNPVIVSLSLGNSCELALHTHQEIVDMAISSILEGIGDPRYKTHQNELRKNE
jgi:hypothetical protein